MPDNNAVASRLLFNMQELSACIRTLYFYMNT